MPCHYNLLHFHSAIDIVADSDFSANLTSFQNHPPFAVIVTDDDSYKTVMSNLFKALSLYEGQGKILSYGTAGFRENVSLPLTSVFVKMGVLVSPFISRA